MRTQPQSGRFLVFVLVTVLAAVALLSAGVWARPQAAAEKFTGVATGVVVEVGSTKEGRGVKVRFPWLDGGTDQAYQARIAVSAVAEALPEVGDEVLVAFEHGDLSRPVVIGALWQGRDVPPVSDARFCESVKACFAGR